MSNAYPQRWSTVWSVLACVVVGVAFLAWSRIGVLCLLVLAVLVAVLLCTGAPARPNDPTSPPLRSLSVDRFATAFRWSLMGLATALLLAASTATGVLVLGLLLGTSPWVVRRCTRRRSGPIARPSRPSPGQRGRGRAAARRDGSAGPLDDLSPESMRALVRRLDVAGLCWAWRSSHALLDQIHDVRMRSQVVMMRQEYLDEMERRDPAGFLEWLEAGPGGTRDPQVYLHDQTGDDGAAAA